MIDFKVGQLVKRIAYNHKGMVKEDIDEIIGADSFNNIDLKYFGTGHSAKSFELYKKSSWKTRLEND